MSVDANKKIDEKEMEKVKSVLEAQKKLPMLQVKSTKEIKLRDKMGRGGLQLDLREVFGFLPTQIVIQKVYGRNNVIVVSAILTEEELEKEKNAQKTK
jgi:hypothetical protein